MIQSGGGHMPVDLFYLFKMINKTAEKVEDFSKRTNKIIVLAKIVDNSVVGLKCFWNRNNSN